jgi:hypothetical protein
MKRSIALPLGALVAAVCSSAWAQTSAPTPAEQPATISLVLRPAAEPRLALKYRLLPEFMDRKPGNAAIAWQKALLLLADANRDPPEKINKRYEEVADWLAMPLAKLPRDKVREALGRWRQALDQADLAARRERCEWEVPIHDRNFITIPLPELQQLRQVGRLVALKARLEIAEGRLDEALRTLQTGCALARHTAAGPTLIHALVGIAIGQMMSDQVRDLVQQPGAPNLYWALTALPRPLIDPRPGLDAEMNMLYLSFPALRDVAHGTRPAEYWMGFPNEIERLLDELQMMPPKLGWRTVMTVLAIKGYPAARRAMLAEGRSPAEVDAMPVVQVVLIYSVRTYEEIRDQIFKWFFVSYPEGRTGMEKAERQLAQARQREFIPLAGELLPAIASVQLSVTRMDRSIAMLRTVEALSLFAAAHDGRLPEKLGDVTQVPVPDDPISGRPFAYRKSGETAVLDSPAPPGKSQKQYGMRFEIKMAK